MKTKTPMDPAAAFPDATRQPDDDALPAAVGTKVAKPLLETLAKLSSSTRGITTMWKFTPQSGWYQIWMLKKRRLLYVIPKRGDFRASLILGGKAVNALRVGPRALDIERLLKEAKRYPEGTAFSFAAADFEPELLITLLTAKMDH